MRRAINNANASPGPDVIVFDFPSYPVTLSLSSELPPITEGVVIDATAPGDCATAAPPRVQLDGLGLGPNANGLLARGTAAQAIGVTFKGLAIYRFGGAGVRLGHFPTHPVHRVELAEPRLVRPAVGGAGDGDVSDAEVADRPHQRRVEVGAAVEAAEPRGGHALAVVHAVAGVEDDLLALVQSFQDLHLAPARLPGLHGHEHCAAAAHHVRRGFVAAAKQGGHGHLEHAGALPGDDAGLDALVQQVLDDTVAGTRGAAAGEPVGASGSNSSAKE